MRQTLIALIAGVVFAGNGAAQTLWKDTQAGMTVEQVQQAIQGATSYAPGPAQKLDSGAVPLLQMPPEEIAGALFQPSFFFLNGKLSQVTLKSDAGFEETRTTFERIRDALRAKYGNEVANTVMKPRVEPFGSMKWTSGRTTISLSVFSFSLMNKGTVFIFYSAELAALGDKL